jgi:hypothetical protein
MTAYVAPPFHEQVENLAFVVNRAPEPELPAAIVTAISSRCQRNVGRGRRRAKFSGEQWSELDPSPHRFVGDIQTALRKQILDVPITEGETHIQPNGVPDDRRRKLMAGKRDRHAPSYPMTGCALTFE